MVILLIVLIGLTSCTTTKETPKLSNNFNSILVHMMPSIPNFPIFPKLNWKYENNKYFLNESDVDKLLNYGENQIPLFEFEMNNYKEQIQIIMDSFEKK